MLVRAARGAAREEQESPAAKRKRASKKESRERTKRGCPASSRPARRKENGQSGYYGVTAYRNKWNVTWQASITGSDGKKMHLGIFNT